MTENSDFIRGSLEQMCPESEIQMRLKERLVHFYEKDGKFIKEFQRSAAGNRTPKANELRTKEALQRTTEYLFYEILPDTRKPFHFVFDFIFDRLRAIRREIVMQNFNEKTTISLLEPQILFLAYSRYRLCEEPMSNFDPKLCSQHLQECLKRTLVCYDELTEELPNRLLIESIYQMLNLGEVEALNRAVRRLPKTLPARKIALAFWHGNWLRAMRLMEQLPAIVAAVGVLHLGRIRKTLLCVFAVAFNSKNSTVPLQWLQRLLLFDSKQPLVNELKRCGLDIGERDVKFEKQKFDASQLNISVKQSPLVDEKLKSVDNLSKVLLLINT